MVFSDEAPALTAATNTGMCRGSGTVATGAYKGTSVLFQRLLGFTPQLRDSTNTDDLQRPPVEALLHGATTSPTGPG